MSTAALAILVASVLFVGYTYLGYPIVVRTLARRVNHQIASPDSGSNDYLPEIAVLMCAYNEASQIAQKLDNCLELDYPRDKLRVYVVSDGSDDGTDNIVGSYPDSRVRLVRSDVRKGKADGINLAMAQIEEPYVLMVDVRQRLDATAARLLVQHFKRPDVAAVSGRLQLDTANENSDRVSFDKGVSGYWDHEVKLREAEARVHSVVGVTGAIYALRRSAFEPIPEGTILDDVLIPMNAVMKGYRILFDSHAVAHDQASPSPELEKQRKVRTLAGNFQLLALRPQLISFRKNPIFWMFVSHKVFRLMVPVAMIGALISSSLLYRFHELFAFLVWVQALGYVLSAIPEKWFRPISFGPVRIGRTFVQMHWFVVLGFFRFLTLGDAHLWTVSPKQERN